MTVVKAPTAREKLQPDRLHQTQLELMGDDIDLKSLYLALGHNTVDIQAAVTDVTVERTIEGASTVTVTVNDRDFALLKSGRLSHANDIEIDGLFFRLVAVNLSGYTLTLTFEDRAIAVLRTYNKPIKQSLKTSRAQVTRAEFVLRMIKEVKEFPIPYVIPELTKVQPITGLKQLPEKASKATNKNFGIPKGNDLKVKTGAMTENQRVVANTILDVATSMVLPRSLLVMAMMCAIQESTMANLLIGKPGDYNFIDAKDPAGNPVGVFQQIPRFWSARGGASRDIASDAHAFLVALATQAKGGGQYQNIIERVQHSGNAAGYAQWRTESERIVNAYGVTSTDAAVANNQYANQRTNSTYEFYRGIPPTTVTRRQKYGDKWGKEDSWVCILRLAAEVQWRAFFVSGVFYYLAEDELFTSQPIATIDHSTEGVDDISPADYDEGKKTATVTLTVQMGRWKSPPGSVIQLENMGPWNGRWLVNDVSRSLFNATGTITLKKPMPRLPEPDSGNIVKTGGNQTWTGGNIPQDPVSSRQYHTGTALVQPVPKGFGNSIVQGLHSTVGLSGRHFGYFPGTWPTLDAVDFGANAGAPVVAVENGTIVHLSGHDPTLGPSDPVLGSHGPFGWSVYLKGDSGAEYYYTHLGSRSVGEGQKVQAGQTIGKVGNYAVWGGVNHVHVGVNPAGAGGRPDITDLMNAPLAVK